MIFRLPLLSLAITLTFAACTTEFDSEFDTDKGDETAFAANDVNAQNSLRFTNLQASCSGSHVQFVEIGADMSALMDSGLSAERCVISGTIDVPAGVYLMGLHHSVSGFSDGQGTLNYAAHLNGREIARDARNTWQSATIAKFANVSAIGRQLCNTRRASRVPFRIDANLSGTGERIIDSFDWSFSSVGYCD